MRDIQITVTAVYKTSVPLGQKPKDFLKQNMQHIETEASLAMPDSAIITVEGEVLK